MAIGPDNDVDTFEFDQAVTEIKYHDTTMFLWDFFPGFEGESKREYLNRHKTLASGDDWPGCPEVNVLLCVGSMD